MNLPRAKNEMNWNTVIQIVTLVGMIAGGGAVWGTTQAAIGSMATKQAEQDASIRANKEQVSRIPNIEYRITVQEQANTSLVAAVEQLRQAMADQSADIKVIREILTRVEPQRR